MRVGVYTLSAICALLSFEPIVQAVGFDLEEVEGTRGPNKKRFGDAAASAAEPLTTLGEEYQKTARLLGLLLPFISFETDGARIKFTFYLDSLREGFKGLVETAEFIRDGGIALAERRQNAPTRFKTAFKQTQRGLDGMALYFMNTTFSSPLRLKTQTELESKEMADIRMVTRIRLIELGIQLDSRKSMESTLMELTKKACLNINAARTAVTEKDRLWQFIENGHLAAVGAETKVEDARQSVANEDQVDQLKDLVARFSILPEFKISAEGVSSLKVEPTPRPISRRKVGQGIAERMTLLYSPSAENGHGQGAAKVASPSRKPQNVVHKIPAACLGGDNVDESNLHGKGAIKSPTSHGPDVKVGRTEFEERKKAFERGAVPPAR